MEYGTNCYLSVRRLISTVENNPLRYDRAHFAASLNQAVYPDFLISVGVYVNGKKLGVGEGRK